MLLLLLLSPRGILILLFSVSQVCQKSEQNNGSYFIIHQHHPHHIHTHTHPCSVQSIKLKITLALMHKKYLVFSNNFGGKGNCRYNVHTIQLLNGICRQQHHLWVGMVIRCYDEAIQNNNNTIWKRQNKASESKTHSPKQIEHCTWTPEKLLASE